MNAPVIVRDEDIAAGFYDGARIQTFIVNWRAPGDFACTRVATLGKITRSMDHAARSLGRGPGSTLWNVHLPIMRGSLLTAGILVFVDVLKELPATLVLRPFNFDTLAVATYNLASDERLAEAAGPALAIVVVGVLPVIMLSRAIGRSRPGTGGAVEGAVP